MSSPAQSTSSEVSDGQQRLPDGDSSRFPSQSDSVPVGAFQGVLEHFAPPLQGYGCVVGHSSPPTGFVRHLKSESFRQKVAFPGVQHSSPTSRRPPSQSECEPEEGFQGSAQHLDPPEKGCGWVEGHNVPALDFIRDIIMKILHKTYRSSSDSCTGPGDLGRGWHPKDSTGCRR